MRPCRRDAGWDDRLTPMRAGWPPPRSIAETASSLPRPLFSGCAVGNHSLTLLLALPSGSIVLAVDPVDLAPRRGSSWLLAALGGHARPRLPRAAASGRAVPGPARLRPARNMGRVLVHRPRRAVPGQPAGPVRWTAAKVRRAGRRGRSPQFGVLAALIPIGFVATAFRRPRYALLTGCRRLHVLLRCVVRERGHRALLPRPGAHRLDLAGHPGRGRAVDVLAVASGEPVPDPAGAAGATGTTERDTAAAPWMSAAAIVLGLALLVPTLTAIPDRYAAVDARRQTDAATWTDHVLAEMAPDSVIVSWWSYSTPLWYAQRVQGKPDVFASDAGWEEHGNPLPVRSVRQRDALRRRDDPADPRLSPLHDRR